MKRIIFCILTTFTTLSYANTNSQFCYGTSQMIGGYPMFGAGYREKKENHGMDFSASVMPLNKFSPIIFHTKGQYLFYPIKENGLYLGAGLGLLNEPETIKGISGSLEPSIGYEWPTSRNSHIFIEASGIVPFKKPEGVHRAWPGISVGIGF